MWEIWIPAVATAAFFLQVEVFRRLRGATFGRGRIVGLALYGVVLFLGVATGGVFGPLGAAMFGIATNVFIGSRSLQVLRREQRVRGLLERVRGPDADEALALLEREVENLRGGHGGEKPNYEHRARWVLGIATQVYRAGHPERALEWTTKLELGIVGRPLAAMYAQHEAVFRIAIGDREGARRAVARAPRPAVAPWEEQLSALDALFEALEGDAEAALRRTNGALDAASPTVARSSWQVVRAHAQARLGATEEARTTLRAIRSESGEDAIRRIVTHDGPASRLAEMLIAEGGAYR